MTIWYALLIPVGLIAIAVGLYGLHRLCLWLEANGHLYYIHKQPDSSRASCFMAFQEHIEPTAKHVHHIKEEKRSHSENEAPGEEEGERGSTE